MKTILSLILLSLSLYSSDREGDREILHEKAGDEFVNFHFFRDGEGMTLTPNLSKFMWMLKPSLENKSQDKGLTERLGKIFGFTTIGTKFVGVFNVPYKKMDIGVLGCTACHSGKAAGVFVPGLGNKEIDPFRIGQNSIMVQSFWGRFGRSREFKRIHQNAMNFSKVTADKNIGNLTRGLVSDAIISTFFYKENGLKYPKMKRAQVKVPHLWGVKEKAKMAFSLMVFFQAVKTTLGFLVPSSLRVIALSTFVNHFPVSLISLIMCWETFCLPNTRLRRIKNWPPREKYFLKKTV